MKEASQEITICLAILSARAAAGERLTMNELYEIEARLERALAAIRPRPITPQEMRADLGVEFPPEAFA